MSDELVDLADYRALKALRNHDCTAMFHEVQAEDDHAAALCDEILTGASVWWPRRLHKAGDSALTLGMLRVLGRRMAERIESRPEEALELSSMALEISTRLLGSTRYPKIYLLKFYTDILRDHAYVLARLGRCEEAIGSVATAEHLREDPPFYNEDGLNALVKAVVLRQLGRNRAAARLARKAASAFAGLSDRRRYRIARRIQAAALYDAGQTDRALAIRACLEDGGTIGWADEQSLTRDIAACLYTPGHDSESERLDQATESAGKTWGQWLIARESMSYTGRLEPAMDVFRATWQELTALGFPGMGALAALDLVKGLLMQRRGAEIPPLCDAVIAELTTAGLAPRAPAALSLLRKAAALELASPELVRATRVVVWSLSS
jgi:tetratricopeptide (TPR) repeat protein